MFRRRVGCQFGRLDFFGQASRFRHGGKFQRLHRVFGPLRARRRAASFGRGGRRFRLAAFAYPLGGGDQRLAAAGRRGAGSQLFDPGPQLARGPLQQRKQRLIGRPQFGQPHVHHFLDAVRGVGKPVQANHPAAALERVEAAPQHGQVVHRARLGARQRQRGVHELQHFLRLGDENFQQLRFDRGFAGRRRRFGHRQRHGRRHLLVQHGNRFGRRHLAERDGAEGAMSGVEGEALARPGRILRQHVDEEAERAHVLRNVVERLRFQRWIALALGQRGDRALHLAGRLHRVVLVEDGERAMQLVHHAHQLVQRRTLGWIDVIVVEHLFHLAQAGFHFHRQRHHRVVLLHLARQAALPLGRRGRHLARDQCLQARAYGVGVGREIARQVTDLLQAVFREQQRGGHLQRQFLAASGRHRPGGHFGQLAQQHAQRGQVQGRAFVGRLGQRAAEGGVQRRIEIRIGQPVPARLGLGHGAARPFQRGRVDLAVARGFVIGRHQAVEHENATQALGQRRRTGRVLGRDEEQGVAQHRFRLRRLALAQAADLQVDQAEQLLDGHAAGQLALGHQLGEALHGQPEGARPRIVLGVGHQHHGIAQGGRVFALLRRIGAFQVRQQRLFVALAPGRIVGRRHRGRQRHGRLVRQVGEEQVGRVDALGAQHAQQVAIIRVQPQRLRRRAVQQLLQVFDQRLV